MALELLQAVVGRIHDFCGLLDEDNLRTNFVLVYEIIDEMIVRIYYVYYFLILFRILATLSTLTPKSSKNSYQQSPKRLITALLTTWSRVFPLTSSD